ncbi:MAG: undecaprenyldiphospho-muramoylpentapeptide beta-N-acetylglucosaminyltransferase [Pseudobdellovibrio sp.]
MNKKRLIMIAGGGTGGHIYPAISIGQALIELDSSVTVEYVGTKTGLEQKIMAKENLPLHLIRSGPLNLSGHAFKKIKNLISIAIGFVQSVRLIQKMKPEFVLGVGGYASAPFLLAAALLGNKTALWEPNAYPGMANRLLSKFVPKAYLVFAEAQKKLKSKDIKIFGMPLRKEIEKARAENRKIESSGKLRLLCFGGSQGATFLNNQLSEFIISNPELHSQIQVVHQTGINDFEKMKAKYSGLSCVEVFDYIYDMPRYYQNADVQFCRGGASTIAEAACFGVIPIVVPLPAADAHQEKNAEVLIKSNAGFMILQSEFKQEDFKKIINQLLTNINLRKDMALNLKKLASEDAAQAIAQDILKNSLKEVK